MKIIIINGPSGSGKSWLGKFLSKKKGIKCYDNDDIISECFYKIYKSNIKYNKNFWKKVYKLSEYKIRNIYVKNLENKKVNLLIFVGAQPMPKFIYEKINNYFIIKITDLETVYKQRIKRDIEKINKNTKKMQKIIKDEPVEHILPLMNHMLMINTEFPQYNVWKQQISDYYYVAKHDWKIKQIYPIDEIIDYINNINKK